MKSKRQLPERKHFGRLSPLNRSYIIRHENAWNGRDRNIKKHSGLRQSSRCYFDDGYGDDAHSLEQAKEFGILCYIAKPFDLFELRERVNEILNSSGISNKEVTLMKRETVWAQLLEDLVLKNECA